MLLSGCLINKQRMVCMFLRYRISPGGFSNTIGAAMVGKSNAALAPDCLFFSFSFSSVPYLTYAFKLYFIDVFLHRSIFQFVFDLYIGKLIIGVGI